MSNDTRPTVRFVWVPGGWVEVRGRETIHWTQADGADEMEPVPDGEEPAERAAIIYPPAA